MCEGVRACEGVRKCVTEGTHFPSWYLCSVLICH